MTNQKRCLPECRCVCPDLYEGHAPSGHAGPEYEHHATACTNAPKPPEAPKVETVTAGPPVTMLHESAEDRFLRIMEPIIADAESRMTPQEIEEANAKIAALVESRSPAPAPEPKQGAEHGVERMPMLKKTTGPGLIDWDAAERWANEKSQERGIREPNMARAYLAIRADLASAREEIADAREQSERTKAEKQELWLALRGRVEELAQKEERYKRISGDYAKALDREASHRVEIATLNRRVMEQTQGLMDRAAELARAEKACALALDYVQGSPRPRHMDVVSALREVIARAKEGEKQ